MRAATASSSSPIGYYKLSFKKPEQKQKKAAIAISKKGTQKKKRKENKNQLEKSGKIWSKFHIRPPPS